ncbi:MAG: endonuclease domain-containing protein [Gammaproteobacteria bacterium]|nr:MAG: endonuclease domain-containing protein [Gammaproteobacteria bacterium]
MKQTARHLRRNATGAEEQLWELLRDRQIIGYKFRRQHPIGRYIADFACPSRRLVIELDGDAHRGRQVLDRQRTAYLASRGFDVMRFWNSAVIRTPDIVLAKIRARLHRKDERIGSSCALTLSQWGEGGVSGDRLISHD